MNLNEQQLREPSARWASSPPKSGEGVTIEHCCSTVKGEACFGRTGKPGTCPSCDKRGKPVTVLTIKSLVQNHTRVPARTSYWFCRTANCEIVYFSCEGVFRKLDLKVRVGIKETADPIPLCYCFHYSREDIFKDIESKGRTAILQQIKAEVQSGFCACEVKNPSGACCLGDITRAIQEAEKHADQRVTEPRSSV